MIKEDVRLEIGKVYTNSAVKQILEPHPNKLTGCKYSVSPKEQMPRVWGGRPVLKKI